MASLFRFGKKKKTAEQLVRGAQEALDAFTVESDEKRKEQALQDITANVEGMRDMLYGTEDKSPNPEKCLALADWIIRSELMTPLIVNLQFLHFETRKHVALVFNSLTRQNLNRFVEQYLQSDKQRPVLDHLVKGYENRGIALNCGSMLRESIRHESIAEILLTGDALFRLLDDYVSLPDFDVASDAFATVKELLTRHHALVARFLDPKSQNYDAFFGSYTKLLQSSYVIQRQALKLLGELLLDRSNFAIMMRFIQDKQNLKLMMNLLRDKAPSIQFEAFHVFKVFVANPKKPEEICAILYANRDKLVRFLQGFHADNDDPQFNEEKSLLIATLRKMAKPAVLDQIEASTAAPAPAPPAPASTERAASDPVAASAASAPAPASVPAPAADASAAPSDTAAAAAAHSEAPNTSSA